MRSAILSVALLFTPCSASAQQGTLHTDASYFGAELKAGGTIVYSPYGYVTEGVLKYDYRRGDFTFEAESTINFDNAGNVIAGTVKNEVSQGSFSFLPGPIRFYSSGAVSTAIVKAGSGEANLKFPRAGAAVFSSDGHVVSFSSASSYAIFNRHLMGESRFSYNSVAKTYNLTSGMTSSPTLVARIVERRNAEGLPTESFAVVLPGYINFQVLSEYDNPSGATRWFPSSFRSNFHDFGPTPEITIRDMKIVFIKISKDLNIGGINFKAGELVFLDESLRPIPRIFKP